MLAHLDTSKIYVLHTDASADGVGTVLSQYLQGQEHVVPYSSKPFSACQRNYFVTRR